MLGEGLGAGEEGPSRIRGFRSKGYLESRAGKNEGYIDPLERYCFAGMASRWNNMVRYIFPRGSYRR